MTRGVAVVPRHEARVFPSALLAAVCGWALLLLAWAVHFAGKPIETAAPLSVDARIVELPPTPVQTPPAKTVQKKIPVKHVLRPKKRMPVHRLKRKTTAAKPRPVTKSTQPAAQVKGNPVRDIMGARAIYNPLPSIPEDLRSQAISEVAVARLHIHVDGTVSVELVRPTHNPRINKIILDTLRTWMFYPAISKGVPIESVQEIKIDVSIGD